MGDQQRLERGQSPFESGTVVRVCRADQIAESLEQLAVIVHQLWNQSRVMLNAGMHESGRTTSRHKWNVAPTAARLLGRARCVPREGKGQRVLTSSGTAVNRSASSP